jgi:hypothetical protein
MGGCHITKGGFMKKILFAVSMVVMLTTACLAEEVKPDRLFSIEGIR